jgi:hypothetical protein
MKKILCLAISSLFCHFIYAQSVNFHGRKGGFRAELLAKALSYSSLKNYKINLINYDIPKQRAIRIMENNQFIDVAVTSVTRHQNRKLLFINFPIHRGLYGWRIALVKKNNQESFAHVNTKAQLKNFRAGQHQNWSDAKIFRYNDMNLILGSNYQGLFSMLNRSRFDYFPRSIFEINNELEKHSNLDLVIEPYIILHYPTYYAFFVKPQNQELAKDIRFGLEQAKLDGSFDSIFIRHYGEVIDQLRSEKRKVIHLANPYIPKDILLKNKKFFIDLTN